MADFSGAAQGFVDFSNQQGVRDERQANVGRMLQQMQIQKWQQDMQQQAVQRQLAARAGAGRVLYDQMQTPPQPPMPGASSPGGTPAGGPPPQGGSQPGGMPGMPPPGGIPPPSGAGAGAPPGGPQMSMPPPQPQQPLPWRPMPSAPPPGAGAPQGGGMPPQLPPPPGQAGPGAAGPDAAAPGGVVPQRTFDLKNIIGTLQKQGVPPEKVMDMLDELAPTMNAANKAELDGYKVQHQLQADVIKYAHQRITELQGDKRIGIAEKEQESKAKDREAKDAARTESNKIKREKLTAALNSKGGGVKIVRWKEDADGNVVGGWDRAGHLHKVDEDAPMTSPKAGARTNREIGQLKEDRRSLVARGVSEKDPRIKALDQQIADMQTKGRGGPKPAGGGKPTPTEADRAWAKAHPGDPRFKERFGVEP